MATLTMSSSLTWNRRSLSIWNSSIAINPTKGSKMTSLIKGATSLENRIMLCDISRSKTSKTTSLRLSIYIRTTPISPEEAVLLAKQGTDPGSLGSRRFRMPVRIPISSRWATWAVNSSRLCLILSSRRWAPNPGRTHRLATNNSSCCKSWRKTNHCRNPNSRRCKRSWTSSRASRWSIISPISSHTSKPSSFSKMILSIRPSQSHKRDPFSISSNSRTSATTTAWEWALTTSSKRSRAPKSEGRPTSLHLTASLHQWSIIQIWMKRRVLRASLSCRTTRTLVRAQAKLPPLTCSSSK